MIGHQTIVTRNGATQIKLATSGGGQSLTDPLYVDEFTFDEIKAAVQAAEDFGTYVTVHSYTPKAGMVCAIAGFLARVPVRIHTFTGLIFPYCTGVKRQLLKRIDALVCLLNTHIVPEGQGVKKDLTPHCSKP